MVPIVTDHCHFSTSCSHFNPIKEIPHMFRLTRQSSDIHPHVQLSPSPLCPTSGTHGCLLPFDASCTVHDSSYFRSFL